MNDNSTTHTSKLKVSYSRFKRKILSHVTIVRILIISFFVTVIIMLFFVSVRAYKKYDLALYLTTANNFLTAPIDQLASDNGRTNILVMGRAGGVHDGPELTDTMMLVSVSLKSQDIKIVSIPRDTWIPEIRAKINSAYYWGNQKEVGGLNLAKAEVSQVLGLAVHYGAVIDFSGFKDVINELGGINVDVPNSFTDFYYPIAGREDDDCGGVDVKFMCRYETLHFAQGEQLMDGETALKFVRSRHAEGIEGTDIARETRQQKVIDAIKNKVSDKSTYTNIKKDMAIIRVILRSVQTDLDHPTAAILARRIYDSKDSIKSYLIPEHLLVNPPVSDKYDLQYVFIPKAGNGQWKEINDWMLTILNQ